jgi:hypothetical protein
MVSSERSKVARGMGAEFDQNRFQGTDQDKYSPLKDRFLSTPQGKKLVEQTIIFFGCDDFGTLITKTSHPKIALQNHNKKLN